MCVCLRVVVCASVCERVRARVCVCETSYIPKLKEALPHEYACIKRQQFVLSCSKMSGICPHYVISRSVNVKHPSC